MIIVAGHLQVDPAGRDAYLASCVDVVRQALAAPGCQDFAISADPFDDGRLRVYERWESWATLTAFRGSGPDGEQQEQILAADVQEFEVRSADGAP